MQLTNPTQAISRPRLSVPEYLTLCKESYLANWKQYSLPLLAVLVLSTVFRIDVNYTDSLPDHVFLTIKGYKDVHPGNYVTYEFPTENRYSPFRKGDHMVKIVAGEAGDEVRMSPDREFTIIRKGTSAAAALLGGNSVGVAKPYSMANKPLEAGQTGVIPADHFYMQAPHKDSLDSRYAMVGFVPKDKIIGITFPLF